MMGYITITKPSLDDATGAGDAFWAGFLVALLDGSSLRRCVLFAREVVARELTTVGSLPDAIDRQAMYASIDVLTDEEAGQAGDAT